MSVLLVWRKACNPPRSIPRESSKGYSIRFTSRLASHGVQLRVAKTNPRSFGFHRLRKSATCVSKRGERANHRTAFSLFGDWTFPRHTL